MLHFNDGTKINTTGRLRTLILPSGMYVIGRGFHIPVDSHKEAKELISDLSTNIKRDTMYSFKTDSKMLCDLIKAGKKVSMLLVGHTGNAFDIIGRFRRRARRELWSEEEIEAVVSEAQFADYDHLISTFFKFTEVGE